MNEKIDLTKILKDCPKGTKLYSPIFGEVEFRGIRDDAKYPIITHSLPYNPTFTKKGFYYDDVDGECLILPSKEQRDWNKFVAPWYKKTGHFDPKTLQPFDRVLVRHSYTWRCELLSHYREYKGKLDFYCTSADYIYRYCIPYNDETKHLVGTTGEAPEYYRYWED